MLRPVTPLIEYIIDYDYISTTLCVNKDKLEMNCKGKCYVSKKLEQSKDKSIKFSKKDYPIYFFNIVSYYFKKKCFIDLEKIYFYQKKYTFIFYYSIFQPPAF